ncbi:uncharacterized protein LOC141914667 [Tubulanus polymorphus]
MIQGLEEELLEVKKSNKEKNEKIHLYEQELKRIRHQNPQDVNCKAKTADISLISPNFSDELPLVDIPMQTKQTFDEGDVLLVDWTRFGIYLAAVDSTKNLISCQKHICKRPSHNFSDALETRVLNKEDVQSMKSVDLKMVICKVPNARREDDAIVGVDYIWVHAMVKKYTSQHS